MTSPSAPQGRKLIKVTPVNSIIQNVYEEKPQANRILIVDGDGTGIDAVTDGGGLRRLAVDAEVTLNVDNIQVDVVSPNLPEIQNYTVLLANTEFTMNLPDLTKHFSVTVRDAAANLRIAFTAGGTNTTYIKVSRGLIFNSGSIDVTAGTQIYLQTDKPNVVVELMSWYNA